MLLKEVFVCVETVVLCLFLVLVAHVPTDKCSLPVARPSLSSLALCPSLHSSSNSSIQLQIPNENRSIIVTVDQGRRLCARMNYVDSFGAVDDGGVSDARHVSGRMKWAMVAVFVGCITATIPMFFSIFCPTVACKFPHVFSFVASYAVYAFYALLYCLYVFEWKEWEARNLLAESNGGDQFEFPWNWTASMWMAASMAILRCLYYALNGYISKFEIHLRVGTYNVGISRGAEGSGAEESLVPVVE